MRTYRDVLEAFKERQAKVRPYRYRDLTGREKWVNGKRKDDYRLLRFISRG